MGNHKLAGDLLVQKEARELQELQQLYFPRGLLYSPRRHTWIKLEDNAPAKVGITQLGSLQLGTLKSILGKNPMSRVEVDHPLASMESVSSVGFLFSPVSCILLRVNPDAVARPGLVNESPYGAGWMAEITPTNVGEESGLLSPATAMKDAAEQTLLALRKRSPGPVVSVNSRGTCCGGA